jgi:hypothetical protein
VALNTADISLLSFPLAPVPKPFLKRPLNQVRSGPAFVFGDLVESPFDLGRETHANGYSGLWYTAPGMTTG